MTYDYDLFVIGAGSGGVRASRIAASYGKKVGICEDYRVGGTCVIRGCVPKKLLVYAAEFAKYHKISKAYGWSGSNNPDIDAQHDWARLIENKNHEINRLNGIYLNLLKNAGVELVTGRGRMLDDHTIEITNHETGKRQTVTAKYILIAVGGTPVVPNIEGSESWITSNEALDLPTFPKEIAIIGGGYIALEFACVFHNLGAKVHLLVREKILRSFDHELAAHLQEELVNAGIHFIVADSIVKTEKMNDGRLKNTLQSGTELVVDEVMAATGRKPNTDDLGIKELGVELAKGGTIITDKDAATNKKHIFAVGDVSSEWQLTPVAIREGHALVDRLFGSPEKHRYFDPTYVASAIFSMPPAASVGYSEQDAIQEFGSDNIQCYKSSFRPMKYTMPDVMTKTFMKMIVRKDDNRVIGVHLVGDDTPEMIQTIAVALEAGATKAQFDATVPVHPTSSEELVMM